MQKKTIKVLFSLIILFLIGLLAYIISMSVVMHREIELELYCILMFFGGVGIAIGTSYIKNTWGIIISDLSIDYILSIPYLFSFWYGMWWLVFAVPMVLILIYALRYKALKQGNEKINKEDIIKALVNTLFILFFSYCNTFILCMVTDVWP